MIVLKREVGAGNMIFKVHFYFERLWRLYSENSEAAHTCFELAFLEISLYARMEQMSLAKTKVQINPNLTLH